MTNAFNQFCQLHIKEDLTSLVRELITNSGYRTQLSAVLSEYDTEELQLAIGCEIDYEIARVQDFYMIFVKRGETNEYYGRAKSFLGALLELAEIADIDAFNYHYQTNRWVSVSRELYDYLADNGELVIEWHGLLIWGTFTREENINNTRMICQAYQDRI